MIQASLWILDETKDHDLQKLETIQLGSTLYKLCLSRNLIDGIAKERSELFSSELQVKFHCYASSILSGTMKLNSALLSNRHCSLVPGVPLNLMRMEPSSAPCLCKSSHPLPYPHLCLYNRDQMIQ